MRTVDEDTLCLRKHDRKRRAIQCCQASHIVLISYHLLQQCGSKSWLNIILSKCRKVTLTSVQGKTEFMKGCYCICCLILRAQGQ